MDTKYAMLVHGQYIPLTRSGTLEQAIDAALEAFYYGEEVNFDRDLDFTIVEITKVGSYNTAEYNDYFEKRFAESRKHQKEKLEKLEREDFERLKKKYECTCREKEVDKTNCPLHREFGN